jgi:hypothetical protein
MNRAWGGSTATIIDVANGAIQLLHATISPSFRQRSATSQLMKLGFVMGGTKRAAAQ